ncbi:hypothetical protein JOM56_015492 [Amanita muscaria]
MQRTTSAFSRACFQYSWPHTHSMFAEDGVCIAFGSYRIHNCPKVGPGPCGPWTRPDWTQKGQVWVSSKVDLDPNGRSKVQLKNMRTKGSDQYDISIQLYPVGAGLGAEDDW